MPKTTCQNLIIPIQWKSQVRDINKQKEKKMSKIKNKLLIGGVILGVAVGAVGLPISSAFAASDNDTFTVQVTVDGLFSVADNGTLTIAGASSTAIGSGSTSVTVTDNSGGTHSLWMAVPYASANTSLVKGADVIPAAASLTAGTAGWQYGSVAGAGPVSTFVQPVKYTDAGDTTGGTVIATTASVTGSTAAYTVGAKAAVASTTPAGTYNNTVKLYAVEQ
jgi:hypothetical protein